MSYLSKSNFFYFEEKKRVYLIGKEVFWIGLHSFPRQEFLEQLTTAKQEWTSEEGKETVFWIFTAFMMTIDNHKKQWRTRSLPAGLFVRHDL